MSRYGVRIGSALALLIACALGMQASAPAAQREAFAFDGRTVAFTQIVSQSGGRAISIDEGAATCDEERTSMRRLIARRVHAELEDALDSTG